MTNPWPEPLSPSAQEASWIIAARLGCTLPDALDLLQRRADAMSRTVTDTARFVITGVGRFDLFSD
jgi:hypothetical protein